MKTLTLLVSLVAIITANAEPRYVTLTDSQSLTIGAYEVAELVSFPVASISTGGSRTIAVIKDGINFQYTIINNNPGGSTGKPFDPLVVTGPAKIVSEYLCTFKILPESFDPTRTVIVAPGTNTTQVQLECSTNLVNWFTATNGVYGPLPEAKFFRIKLAPVPAP